MKTKWMAPVILAGILMTSGSVFAQSRFSVGIGIGLPGYYAPPVVAYRPPFPGQGYYWVDGYYDDYGSFVAGYWAPPAYGYGYGYGYVAPRYYAAPRYYGGGFGGYYGGSFRRGFDRDDFRGRQNFNGGGRDFDRGRQNFNGGGRDFDRGRQNFNGGGRDFDRGRQNFNGGGRDGDRGRGEGRRR